jgi:hypothetical protein
MEGGWEGGGGMELLLFSSYLCGKLQLNNYCFKGALDKSRAILAFSVAL